MESTDFDQAIASKVARLKYGREKLLKIKQNVADQDAADSKSNILPSTLSENRNYSRRAKQPFSRAHANEKSRESDGIVLGPQKRTWNTGCHVSQPNRGSLDLSQSGRSMKFTSDYRPLDKYGRGHTDPKRENRADRLNGRERGRGGAIRSDGSFFSRSYRHSRDDFACRGRSSDHMQNEEEPEWFSEGPTTVNDTIELGGIIDDCEFSASSQKKSCVELHSGSEDASRVNSNSLSERLTHNSDECEVSVSSADKDSAECKTVGLLDSADLADSSRGQGSRFRHLFTKDGPSSEGNNAPSYRLPNSGDINARLMKLLKGTQSTGTKKCEPPSISVSEVEETLRSVLLGRKVQNDAESTAVKPTNTQADKPKVLTVEEIEAQMNLPRGDTLVSTRNAAPRISSYDDSQTQTVFTSTPPPVAPQFANPANTSNSVTQTVHSKQPANPANLVPILQSLLLKQQSTQQPMHPRSALNPFGVLGNSILRLPSTNAVSASARINQLQQPEMNSHISFGDSNISTQVIPSQPWDSSRILNNTLHRPVAQSSTNAVPRYPGISEPLVRCGFGTNVTQSQPMGIGGTVHTGRPIVKVQQNTVTSTNSSTLPGINQFSHSLNSATVMENHTSAQREVDRRILTQLALKHPYLVRNGTPSGLNESTSSHCRSACLRSSGPMPVQPATMLHASANNSSSTNNNISFIDPYTIGSTMATSEAVRDPLVFLSNLARMEKSRAPLVIQNPSNNCPIFNCSNVQAKTLEEIERP